MSDFNLPVLWGHDYTQPPLGKVEERDGSLIIKINPEHPMKLKKEHIDNINLAFAPGYRVIKEKDGLVEEVELIEISVVPGRSYAGRANNDNVA